MRFPGWWQATSAVKISTRVRLGTICGQGIDFRTLFSDTIQFVDSSGLGNIITPDACRSACGRDPGRNEPSPSI